MPATRRTTATATPSGAAKNATHSRIPDDIPAPKQSARLIQKYIDRVSAITTEDPHVFEGFTEVVNMHAPPTRLSSRTSRAGSWPGGGSQPSSSRPRGRQLGR